MVVQQRGLFPGIRSRIVVPYLLIVLLITGLGLFITTRLVASSIQERFTNQLVDSASAASNMLVQIENTHLATLRLMSYTDGVASALVEGDLERVGSLLRPIAANGGVEQVIVFDPAGYPLLGFESRPPPSSASASPLVTTPTHAELLAWRMVRNVLDQKIDQWGDKFAQIDPARRMLYVSAPITDTDGELVGGLVSGVSLATVARELSEQSLSGIVLYDQAGAVLAHTFVGDTSQLDLTAERAADLSADTPQTAPLADVDVDGRPFQIMYATLRLRGEGVGLLGVTLPSNFIVERSSTSRNVLGLLFSGVFVSVILIGFVISRTITGPVIRLVETTRAIRGGDWSRRVGLSIPDELGELGNSFDAMTEQLVLRNQEISQLYQAQVQETARRDAVLTSISEALFVLDNPGPNQAAQITLKNANAEHLLGSVRANLAETRLLTDLLAKPDELREPHTVALSERVFRAQAAPIMDNRSLTLGYVVTLQDITALVETERIKDDLVMQMSHELRTPLSAVRGYFDLIQMFDAQHLSEQSQQFAGLVGDNLTILERMINEVIDVSAVVSNHFHLNQAQVDLNRLLEARVNHWQPQMENRELTISLRLPTPALTVYADEERLAQVLDHVLRNAYSYSLPGGHVSVSAEEGQQHVTICVADQGVGIAEDEIEKVFERMYRGRSAEAGPTDARGLGLGLYLSKYIVEAHRGEIRLESELGKGTTLILTLPHGVNEA
jgi:signal transduction histidine kinase